MDEVQENNAIDEEKIAQVLAGERSHSELTEAELDVAADRQETALNGNEEEQSTETLDVEETTIVPVSMEDGINAIDKDKEIKTHLAEINRLKQIADDRDGKLKKAQSDPEFRRKLFGETDNVTVDENKDYLDDKYLATLEVKIEALERTAQERATREERSDKEIELKRTQLSLFEEINGLQGQYASLATSESFQSIDAKITTWQKTALENNVDVDKYVADAGYRKKADSLGHKINVSPEDLQKAWSIYDVYSDFKKEKEDGYKTSLSRVFKDSPVYDKLSKQKYASHIAADDDALEQLLRQREKEPMIMSPGSNNATPKVQAFEVAVMEMESIASKSFITEADNKRYTELERVVDSYDEY